MRAFEVAPDGGRSEWLKEEPLLVLPFLRSLAFFLALLGILSRTRSVPHIVSLEICIDIMSPSL